MAIVWDSTLEVGVAVIDAQHRELFARIDALLEAIAAGRSASEVDRLLGFLGTYVVEHFGAEERLMRARSYPGLEEHVRQHLAFVEDLRAFEDELMNDGPSALLTVKVNRRMVDWLRGHIYRSDKALGTFLLAAA